MVKIICSYIAIFFAALLTAVTYEMFVFPNHFAPAGINGICTMVQYVSGFHRGYMSLLINIPLALWCLFKVSRPMSIRSLVFICFVSICLFATEALGIQSLAYSTNTGTSTLLGPIIGGIIMGYVYYILCSCGSYSGGIDFVSAIIRHKNPSIRFFRVTFWLNCLIAGASYFVYGKQIEPVLLCILYCFFNTTVGSYLMQKNRAGIAFQIITDRPEEISKELIVRLRHSATMLQGRGMYHGDIVSVLFCVVNREQQHALCEILQKYPQTFAVEIPVTKILGNFHHFSKNGEEIPEWLDAGDLKTE